MSSPTPLITGTDFITVATRDFDSAVAFYGVLSGLTQLCKCVPRPTGRGSLSVSGRPPQQPARDLHLARPYSQPSSIISTVKRGAEQVGQLQALV